METKDLIEHLREWHENLISEMCADDVLTCDDLCGYPGPCIVIQAANLLEAQQKRIAELEAALREQEGDNRLESDAVKNEPLTLDELRKMDGEPVFLVDLVHKSDPETPNLWGGWIVFTNHNTNGFIPRGGGFFSNYGYGKTWLAYRSNPKKRIVRMCRKEV